METSSKSWSGAVKRTAASRASVFFSYWRNGKEVHPTANMSEVSMVMEATPQLSSSVEDYRESCPLPPSAPVCLNALGVRVCGGDVWILITLGSESPGLFEKIDVV